MNCLNFDDKKSYIETVEKMSDEAVASEGAAINNLLSRIRYDYNMFRSNLYSKYISEAAKLLKTENDDAKKIGYMRLLEKTFKGAKKANALLAGFSKIADSGDGMFLFTDENVTRDVALKNIEDSYELIWGEFEKFDHLSRSVMKLCDIALYKVYGIKKHDPEYLEIFSEAPWILFGGTDENGIIDYAYALKSFINLIIFYIEFYDDKLLIQ